VGPRVTTGSFVEVDVLLHQPQIDSCTRTSLDARSSSLERALYTALSTSVVVKSASRTHFGRRYPFCVRLLYGSAANPGALWERRGGRKRASMRRKLGRQARTTSTFGNASAWGLRYGSFDESQLHIVFDFTDALTDDFASRICVRSRNRSVRLHTGLSLFTQMLTPLPDTRR